VPLTKSAIRSLEWKGWKSKTGKHGKLVKLENLENRKTWRGFSALMSGEGPWNGFGRRRRPYGWNFGGVSDGIERLIG
jgi:hypothetical protein